MKLTWIIGKSARYQRLSASPVAAATQKLTGGNNNATQRRRLTSLRVFVELTGIPEAVCIACGLATTQAPYGDLHERFKTHYKRFSRCSSTSSSKKPLSSYTKACRLRTPLARDACNNLSPQVNCIATPVEPNNLSDGKNSQ